MQMKLPEKVALFFGSPRIEAETGIFGCTWMPKAKYQQQQVEVEVEEKEINKIWRRNKLLATGGSRLKSGM